MQIYVRLSAGEDRARSHIERYNREVAAEHGQEIRIEGSDEERQGTVSRNIDVEAYLPMLASELPLVPAKLMGKQPELFATYDRYVSESEFQASTAVPLLFGTVAIVTLAWVAFLILTFPCLLFYEAWKRRQTAGDFLAEQLLDVACDSVAIKNLTTGEIKLLPQMEREFQEEAWHLRLRLLGASHHDTLAAMDAVASSLRGEGKIGAALKFHDQIIDCHKDHHDGLYTSAGLDALENQAQTLMESGDTEGAMRLQEEVVKRRNELATPGSVEAILSSQNLARFCSRAGDYARAVALQEANVRRCEVVDGRRTACFLEIFSSILEEKGDIRHAREVQERAVKGHKESRNDLEELMRAEKRLEELCVRAGSLDE